MVEVLLFCAVVLDRCCMASTRCNDVECLGAPNAGCCRRSRRFESFFSVSVGCFCTFEDVDQVSALEVYSISFHPLIQWGGELVEGVSGEYGRY